MPRRFLYPLVRLRASSRRHRRGAAPTMPNRYEHHRMQVLILAAMMSACGSDVTAPVRACQHPVIHITLGDTATYPDSIKVCR